MHEKKEKQGFEQLPKRTVEFLAIKYQNNSRFLEDNDVDFKPGTTNYDRQIRSRAENALIREILGECGRGDLLRRANAPTAPRR